MIIWNEIPFFFFSTFELQIKICNFVLPKIRTVLRDKNQDRLYDLIVIVWIAKEKNEWDEQDSKRNEFHKRLAPGQRTRLARRHVWTILCKKATWIQLKKLCQIPFR